MDLSSEMIVGVAGMALSVLFSYVPGLRGWYASLQTEYKQLIMLGLVVLTTASIFALDCYGVISTTASCDKDGIISLVWMLVLGLTSNQAAYLISPQTGDVKEAKLIRDQEAFE